MAPRFEDPKLITGLINFELVESTTYMRNGIPQRYGQTDRRTEGRTTYDSNTAR